MNLIQSKVMQLEGGAFQSLLDEYLYKKYKFTNIQTLGVQTATNKPTKGTPDAYVLTEDGKYILINYGSVSSQPADKIKADILSCFNTAKLSLENDKIKKIICGHCSTNIHIEQFDSIIELLEGIEIELIGIDTLSHDLALIYPHIAKNQLGVEIDTNQFFDIEDFVKAYDANGINAPINCDFLHRKKEIDNTCESIRNNTVTVLTGPSGIGKTRLAIEVCREWDDKEYKVYCVRSNGNFLYEDIKYYIDNPGKYMLFFDDANMVVSMDNVLQTLLMLPPEYEIKILITVRDYARKRVINTVSKYTVPKVIEIERLTDEEIKEALDKGIIGVHDMIKYHADDRVVICEPVDALGHSFSDINQAILAYENKEISLHQRIKVKRTVFNGEGKEVTGIIDTTLGRCLFNEILPQDLGFVKRETDEDYLKLEVDFHVGKKQLKQILEKVINNHGATKTAEVLDNIKAMGYKFSTRAAMTVSISDMTVPESKKQILADAEHTVDEITKHYRRGFLTDEERYKEVIETWQAADNELTTALLSGLDKYNNIFMMADSGARGSDKQIKQLAGMRGLMADTTGKTIELPIKSNFREGLDVLEYFISAHGARKGMSDTALRTADSGYLTRRLVDVSQDLIIRDVDCCEGKAIPFMEIEDLVDGNEVIESLEERITGRTAAETMYDAEGNMIVKANHMITPKRAARIVATGVKSVKIRTILTCKSHVGVCAKCYGANMATGQRVQVGEAVGIIAAQSIGEPGTQLTMRTFHTGGVAGDDITQGLPRVEELFEARKPKGLAIIAEFGGVAEIKETKKKREIIVTNPETGESKAYLIPYGSKIKILDGAVLEAGDELTNKSKITPPI